MAGPAVNRREIIRGGIIAIGAALTAVLLQGPLGALDDRMTALQYQVRGDRRADTNVVIVYIDQEAVKSLQWPVRRNFYALLLKALEDLRAGAVGIEAIFEDPKPEYPEYDVLLARMIAASGNVVLTSYFDSVAAIAAAAPDDSLFATLFDFPALLVDVPVGMHMHLPLPAIRAGAAGVGHVNIEDNADVDLYLANGGNRVPSFGLELLRVATRTPRSGVVAEERRLTFRRPGVPLVFSSTSPGRVTINFPGGLRTFTAYPMLEVLRAYDALRTDRPTAIPGTALQGKIVLVGVIAEGRSEFLRTPVDERLPAIVLHGALIENALNNNFMTRTPGWAIFLACLLTAVLASAALLYLRTPLKRIVLALLFLIVITASYLLFTVSSVAFPVTPPVVAMLASVLAGLIVRQRHVRERVDSLESEKRLILERLHDREAKVATLERELVNMEAARANDRSAELLEEIRRYRAEIRTLSSQADDMDLYEADRDELSHAREEFEGIVYDADGALKTAMDFVGKIAPSDAPVLILGESGTGKELVAKALHRRSPRAGRTFVAVNCGALSESLLESELFGHEKGAFTGAVREKPGRFELANHGTIFLDEIGEVSEGFQLKLLRVLQEGEFERVGGTATLTTDVRVVAATNKDLRELVVQKKFRDDLFYRLNVLTVGLPPLRERQSDIPLLIDHFLKRQGGDVGISKNVMEALRRYAWPGNVRELESAIMRGVLLARAEQRRMITVKDLTEEIASAARGTTPIEEQVLESLRDKAFSRSSVTETADELGGLNRGTVAEYLRGECLKAFAECTFDVEKAVRKISLSADPAVNDRVRRKYADYLANIAAAVAPSQPWDMNRSALRPKAKNLPQKYHLYLEQVGEAYFRGVWKVETLSNGAREGH